LLSWWGVYSIESFSFRNGIGRYCSVRGYMFIDSIRLQNFLSYGDNSEPVELRNLNIIIGPNGSGKSNLIGAIELLRSTPGDILSCIRDGGGIHEWLWKGNDCIGGPVAAVGITCKRPHSYPEKLRYQLEFVAAGQRFEIAGEELRDETGVCHYKGYEDKCMLRTMGEETYLLYGELDPAQSILSQRKDPDLYPELTYLGNSLSEIEIYREWAFGRYTALRSPQKADLPEDSLTADGGYFTDSGRVIERCFNAHSVDSHHTF